MWLGQVGFLSNENRVCVALSRAQHGLYVVGNMEVLCKASEVWPAINDTLAKGSFIGNTFPIR